MEDRNSFRGYGITEDFASKFKASKFYTEIFQKHNDEVIIGVRDGYICLYYNCDCIAKIEPAETLTAKIHNYYTDGRHPELTDEQMVALFPLIKEKSDARCKNEKQCQQRLFIQNNNSVSSKWFCVDVEFTKSLKGKKNAEDWRFDIIAISKTKPHKVALVELKYGAGALAEPAGIRTHIKDFYSFHNLRETDGFCFHELKNEVVSMIEKLRLLGVAVPDDLHAVDVESMADKPEYYFITFNNNCLKDNGSNPKQTMSGYLFSDKRWGCRRVSQLVQKEGDYFELVHHDVSFNSVFLFSEKRLPDFCITDIINDEGYELEIVNVV